MTIRVQVKTKTDGKPSTRIKLTNALRFANEPDPCFIALWWRNAKHTDERVYARHFDEALMEATLRRAREAQRDGKTELHKLYVTVPFESKDEHTEDLINWIRSFGESGPDDYALRKRELRERLGFAEDRLGGTLKVPLDDAQKLIDAAVGLPSGTPNVEISFGEKRFGIVAPMFEGKPRHFGFDAAPRAGHLSFTDPEGRTASFEGTVRRFAIEQLPLETARAVFSAPGIEGVVRGQRFDINYELGGDERHPMSRLASLVRFMVISKSRCSVALALSEDDEPLETSCGPIDIEDRELFVWLDEALDSLRACCGGGIDPELSCADIIDAQDDLVNFSIAGAPGKPTFDLETKSDLALPPVSNLVAYRLIRLGEATFYSILRRGCLDQSGSGARAHFRFGDPIEFDAGALVLPESEAAQEVGQRFAFWANQVGKGAMILNGGDYLSVMRNEAPRVEIM